MIAVLLSLLIFGTSSYVKGGSLSARVSGKLQSHVSNLSKKGVVAGIFGLTVLGSGYVCQPAFARCDGMAHQQHSIVQDADVAQGSVENAEEVVASVNAMMHRVYEDGSEPSKTIRALWLAAYFGDVAKVQTLVSHALRDGYVDPIALELSLAMSYAIEGGHLDVVKYLLPQDKTVTSTTRLGTPRWHHNLRLYSQAALEQERWDILRYIADSGVSFAYFAHTVKHAAATQNETAMFHLRAAGAEVMHFNLVMTEAARMGQLDEVKFLHTQGADDLKDAMTVAAGAGELAVVQYLHAQGAGVNALNSALLRVAEKVAHGWMSADKALEVSEFLIAEGANNLNSALRLVVDNVERDKSADDILEVAELLIAKGADDIVGALRVAHDQLRAARDDGVGDHFLIGELTALVDYFKNKHMEKILK